MTTRMEAMEVMVLVAIAEVNPSPFSTSRNQPRKCHHL